MMRLAAIVGLGIALGGCARSWPHRPIGREPRVTPGLIASTALPIYARVLGAATARVHPARAAPAHDPTLDQVAQVAAASAADGYVVSSEAVHAAIARHLGSGLDPYLLTARGDDDEVAAQLGAAIAELRAEAGIATIGVAEVATATGRVVALVAMPPPIRRVAIDRVANLVSITVAWPWPSPPRAFDVSAAGVRGVAAVVRDQRVVLTIDCARRASRTIELDAGDVLVASVVNVCAPSPTAAPPAVDIGPRARTRVEIEQRLFELINRDRVAAGRVALAWEPAAQRMARRHAARMHTLDFMGHVAPDGEGLPERVAVAGLDAAETFENVGLADGPGRAHLAFMTSPGHRHNLLAERARRGAVGIVASARDPGWFYVTEVFFEPQR